MIELPADLSVADQVDYLAVFLVLAYALHGLQLLVHAARVRRAVRVFNDLAAGEGFPPIVERLGDSLPIRRSAMNVPPAVSSPRRCPSEHCRAAMDRIANFCPRCGRHVGPEIDALG